MELLADQIGIGLLTGFGLDQLGLSLVLRSLKPCFRLQAYDLSLNISICHPLSLICLCLLHKFGCLSICIPLGQMLLALCLRNQLSTSSQSGNFLNLVLRLHLNLCVFHGDLLHLFVVIQRLQSLDVVSFQCKSCLGFIVLQLYHLMLVVLDLMLELDITCSGIHQDVPEVHGDQGAHDVYLFDLDAIGRELPFEILANLISKLCLDVTKSHHANLRNEIADFLIRLLLKQLFQTIWAEVVEELCKILLQLLRILDEKSGIRANMEVDTNLK